MDVTCCGSEIFLSQLLLFDYYQSIFFPNPWKLNCHRYPHFLSAGNRKRERVG